jgi:hypothetical protein
MLKPSFPDNYFQIIVHGSRRLRLQEPAAAAMTLSPATGRLAPP